MVILLYLLLALLDTLLKSLHRNDSSIRLFEYFQSSQLWFQQKGWRLHEHFFSSVVNFECIDLTQNIVFSFSNAFNLKLQTSCKFFSSRLAIVCFAYLNTKAFYSLTQNILKFANKFDKLGCIILQTTLSYNKDFLNHFIFLFSSEKEVSCFTNIQIVK